MLLFTSSLRAPLRSNNLDQQLDFLPQELTIYEIIATIFIFVWRQLLYIIGLRSDNSIKTTITGDEQYILPKLELLAPFRISRTDLKRFEEAVSTTENHDLLDDPAQICLFLSALSEPAMLLLLSHPDCPIRPLGSVNVRNRFELSTSAVLSCRKLLELQTCEVHARLLPETRKVKRGLEIDIQVDIIDLTGGTEHKVFQQTFTMLQFMRFKTRSMAIPQVDLYTADTAWLKDVAGTTNFQMSLVSPRAWAAICKDYNPIHISKLAARLFDFPSVIAHGNHALAIALASYHNTSRKHSIDFKRITIEVQFRRPIVLPTNKGLRLKSKQDSADAERFWIVQGEKICVVASVEGL
ncbi:hypothetical protein H2198_004613 [Neophaeococcomyces mojaviensis]|uniref:Uncharacterized protein n=1 Tax=Neophaeococcomyces mojaviensis TaxID=3383035 RepID=A0ACC3A832_9EURO|nr:hypothetical protein H2198_004613 [Knufia sp. JES_112]